MESGIPTPLDDVLAELSITERGFVLGALLLGHEPDAPSAVSVVGSAADRCLRALAAVAALPRQERLRCMDTLAREAIAPLPPGLATVQEDILVSALENEPAPIIRAVAAHGPAVLQQAAAAALRAQGAPAAAPSDREGDGAAATAEALPAEVLADLQRAVLAKVMAVSPRAGGAPPKRLGRRLATLPPEELLAEVMGIGADLLGMSLRGAEDSTLRRALLHAGAAWSRRISEAARAEAPDGDPASLAAEAAHARALTASVTPGANPHDTLARLGARALGHRLKDEESDLTLSVAQRLPPAPRRELLAGAGGSLPPREPPWP